MSSYLRCENPSCSSLASYNFRSTTHPRFCIDHRYCGMVNFFLLRRGKCLCTHQIINDKEIYYCWERAEYNYANLFAPEFCSKHVKPGMVKTQNNYCQSCYGQFNHHKSLATHSMSLSSRANCWERRPTFCKWHRVAEERKFERKRQQRQQNGNNNNFAIFFAEAKSRGLICFQPQCNEIATHGFADDAIPTHCYKHRDNKGTSKQDNKGTTRQEKRISLQNHRTCNVCIRPAGFANELCPHAEYCVLHKDETMLYKLPICVMQDNCLEQAQYGFNQDSIIACEKHCTEEMEILQIRVPITNQCKYNGCKEVANCNYPNKNHGLYCEIHKLDGMFSLPIFFNLALHEKSTKLKKTRCDYGLKRKRSPIDDDAFFVDNELNEFDYQQIYNSFHKEQEKQEEEQEEQDEATIQIKKATEFNYLAFIESCLN